MLSRTKSVDSFIFIFFFLPPPLSLYLKFHFGTTTAPLPTPPTKPDYFRRIEAVWFPPLAGWHSSYPLFHTSQFGTFGVQPDFRKLQHLITCSAAPLLFSMFFSLPYFSSLTSVPPSSFKKKKKLNQITLFCTYSDILPFLLKASIFS